MLLIALGLVALGVLQIIFPRRDGSIKIPHKANQKGSLMRSNVASNFNSDKISLINAVPGDDFDRMQCELGAVIESAKNNLEI